MRKWIWKALDEVVNKKVYSNLYLRNHLQEVDEKDLVHWLHAFFMEPFKIIVIVKNAGQSM